MSQLNWLAGLPNLMPVNSILQDPTATGRTAVVGVAAYQPFRPGAGQGKHIGMDADGHCQAVSFRVPGAIAGDLLTAAGVAEAAGVKAGARLPLIGGLLHLVVDAFPGVKSLKDEDGERQQAKALCRSAAENEKVAAAMLEYLVYQLGKLKTKGFERVIFGCFSKPSMQVVPLLLEACNILELPVVHLALPDGTLHAAHPEMALRMSAPNCRKWHAWSLDAMVARLLEPLLEHSFEVVAPGGRWGWAMQQYNANLVLMTDAARSTTA